MKTGVSKEAFESTLYKLIENDLVNRQLTMTKQDILSDSEDITINSDKLYVSEITKKQAFIDLWNDRCNFNNVYIYGKYDPDNAPDADHPFFLNELWFTYKDAVNIFNASGPKYCEPPLKYTHTYPNVKTIIPSACYGGSDHRTYDYCVLIENIAFVDGYMAGQNKYQHISGNFGFYQCVSLKRVLNPIQPSTNLSASAFQGCYNLYELKLHLGNEYCTSADLRNVPKWSLDSVRYTVEHKTIEPTVTITVHPDVYAKLTGDTSNAVVASMSEEERAQWMELLEISLSKNISFATV